MPRGVSSDPSACSAGSPGSQGAAGGAQPVTTRRGKKNDPPGVCPDKAQGFETATKNLEEELETLARAKLVVSETIEGTLSIAYDLNQTVFLQFGLDSDVFKFEAARYIRDLALKRKPNGLCADGIVDGFR